MYLPFGDAAAFVDTAFWHGAGGIASFRDATHADLFSAALFLCAPSTASRPAMLWYARAHWLAISAKPNVVFALIDHLNFAMPPLAIATGGHAIASKRGASASNLF